MADVVDGDGRTPKTFMVTIDVEYLIEDERAVLAAGVDSSGGRSIQLRDSIAQLIEDKFGEQALDLDGARVAGHSLTLPG